MTMTDDQLLASLERLEAALEANGRRAEQMNARIADIRRQRDAGRSYSEIVSEEHRPLVVELLTESAQALFSAGVLVRRMEAQALHREGMTMDQIARLFGVTRQRVSALLRDARLAQQHA